MAEPEDDAPPILLPCSICSRTFKPESLQKHSKVCERNVNKKRKVFDSSKQRIQGTELAEFLPVILTKKTEKTVVKKPQSKWKENHLEFVRAIRAARGVEGPNKSTSSTSPYKPSNHEKCPHCERHFGPKAFDRHLEWCREQKARIPKSPASLQAKERLEARIKYRAPPLAKSKRRITREKYAPPSHHTSQELSPTPNCHTTAPITPVINHQQPQMSTAMPTIKGTKPQGGRIGIKSSTSSTSCGPQQNTLQRASIRQRSASPIKQVNCSVKSAPGKPTPVKVKEKVKEVKEDLFSGSCNIMKLQPSSNLRTNKQKKSTEQPIRPSSQVVTRSTVYKFEKCKSTLDESTLDVAQPAMKPSTAKPDFHNCYIAQNDKPVHFSRRGVVYKSQPAKEDGLNSCKQCSGIPRDAKNFENEQISLVIHHEGNLLSSKKSHPKLHSNKKLPAKINDIDVNEEHGEMIIVSSYAILRSPPRTAVNEENMIIYKNGDTMELESIKICPEELNKNETEEEECVITNTISGHSNFGSPSSEQSDVELREFDLIESLVRIPIKSQQSECISLDQTSVDLFENSELLLRSSSSRESTSAAFGETDVTIPVKSNRPNVVSSLFDDISGNNLFDTPGESTKSEVSLRQISSLDFEEILHPRSLVESHQNQYISSLHDHVSTHMFMNLVETSESESFKHTSTLDFENQMELGHSECVLQSLEEFCMNSEHDSKNSGKSAQDVCIPLKQASGSLEQNINNSVDVKKNECTIPSIEQALTYLRELSMVRIPNETSRPDSDSPSIDQALTYLQKRNVVRSPNSMQNQSSTLEGTHVRDIFDNTVQLPQKKFISLPMQQCGNLGNLRIPVQSSKNDYHESSSEHLFTNFGGCVDDDNLVTQTANLSTLDSDSTQLQECDVNPSLEELRSISFPMGQIYCSLGKLSLIDKVEEITDCKGCKGGTNNSSDMPEDIQHLDNSDPKWDSASQDIIQQLQDNNSESCFTGTLVDQSYRTERQFDEVSISRNRESNVYSDLNQIQTMSEIWIDKESIKNSEQCNFGNINVCGSEHSILKKTNALCNYRFRKQKSLKRKGRKTDTRKSNIKCMGGQSLFKRQLKEGHTCYQTYINNDNDHDCYFTKVRRSLFSEESDTNVGNNGDEIGHSGMKFPNLVEMYELPDLNNDENLEENKGERLEILYINNNATELCEDDSDSRNALQSSETSSSHKGRDFNNTTNTNFNSRSNSSVNSDGQFSLESITTGECNNALWSICDGKLLLKDGANSETELLRNREKSREPRDKNSSPSPQIRMNSHPLRSLSDHSLQENVFNSNRGINNTNQTLSRNSSKYDTDIHLGDVHLPSISSNGTCENLGQVDVNMNSELHVMPLGGKPLLHVKRKTEPKLESLKHRWDVEFSASGGENKNIPKNEKLKKSYKLMVQKADLTVDLFSRKYEKHKMSEFPNSTKSLSRKTVTYAKDNILPSCSVTYTNMTCISEPTFFDGECNKFIDGEPFIHSFQKSNIDKNFKIETHDLEIEKTVVLPLISNQISKRKDSSHLQQRTEERLNNLPEIQMINRENVKRNSSLLMKSSEGKSNMKNVTERIINQRKLAKVHWLPPMMAQAEQQKSSFSTTEGRYDPYASAERQMMELLSQGDCRQETWTRPVARSAPPTSASAQTHLETSLQSAFARYDNVQPMSNSTTTVLSSSFIEDLENLIISGHSNNSLPSSNRNNPNNNNSEDLPDVLASLGLSFENNNFAPGERPPQKPSKIRSKMEKVSLSLQQSVSLLNYENGQIKMGAEHVDDCVYDLEDKGNFPYYPKSFSLSSPDSKSLLPNSTSQYEESCKAQRKLMDDYGIVGQAMVLEDEQGSAHYRRSVASKFSADSAYSSLNRRSPNTGQRVLENTEAELLDTSCCRLMSSSSSESSLPPLCTVQVLQCESKSPSLTPTPPPAMQTSPVQSKMPKFCHECGSKYPVSGAKFCCQCGARRLVM